MSAAGLKAAMSQSKTSNKLKKADARRRGWVGGWVGVEGRGREEGERNEGKVPEHHARGIMATAEDLEQQEGQPQPNVKEKHRGKREGLRS